MTCAIKRKLQISSAFPKRIWSQQVGADWQRADALPGSMGAAHSHSGKEQGGTVFSRGTNPTLLPVPSTKPTLHKAAPPFLSPLHACSLGSAMHPGGFYPIAALRDSKFPPSLFWRSLPLLAKPREEGGDAAASPAPSCSVPSG